MSQSMTSNSLIASVKRRASIPDNQNVFAEADFLAFANEEISLGLLPTILRLHEDYLLYSEEIPLVANQSNYPIPYRAIGNKLRELSFKDTDGNIREMTRIGIGEISDHQYAFGGGNSGIHKFYVQNNEIILVPSIKDNITGSLVMTYYIRPNELVVESRTGIVKSINTVTGVVTLQTFPSVFVATDSLSQIQKYDFIQAKTPHKSIGIDVPVVSVDSAAKTITFLAANLPDNLAIGDYINLATECIVPQVPLDLHVVLAHRTAARCLEALGDTEALQNANTKLQEMEINTPSLIDNRVEDAPRKLVNRHGFLRRGLGNRRF